MHPYERQNSFGWHMYTGGPNNMMGNARVDPAIYDKTAAAAVINTNTNMINNNVANGHTNHGFQHQQQDHEMQPTNQKRMMASPTHGGGGGGHMINMDGGYNGGGAGSPTKGRMIDAKGGSTLSAHNINYSVKVSTKCCGPSIDRQILNNVTGVFKPGLSAIMGPSGSGKTSFLNVISDRIESNRVQGKILLDGQQVPDNFKCMVGFVVQDDTVMGTLTVRENFAFSAALRLPSSTSSSDRKQLIEEIIVELGLQKCADSKIGTPFLRGVSGGERKRCNIGMELIISPPVLFLDEPTSGLDSNTANSVLELLRKLADNGRTIILSIHQPRYSIYKLFDTLMLLSHGNTVYFGPSQQALQYFQQQGYVCQQHNNPPDFFLDVISADPSTLKEISKSGTIEDPETMHNKLTQGFQGSNWNAQLQSEAGQLFAISQAGGGQNGRRRTVEYATSPWTQFLVVSGRSFRDLVRNPMTGMAVVGTSIVFSLFLMAVYWQLDKTPVPGYNDRSGLFFFMVMVQMFFNLGAMEAYVKEKVMFMHENKSGYYRASVYFLVKVFCDILPLRAVAVSSMCAIVYFAAGLKDTLEAFLLFVLCLFLVSVMASALCFFMAVSFQTFVAAQMLMALIYMMMMLFSGFLINLGSIGDWFSWMQYFSMVKYGLAGLFINELKDRTFCANATDVTTCKTGNTFLEEQKVDYETDFDFWVNYLALFLLGSALFALSYVQLRRMKRQV